MNIGSFNPELLRPANKTNGRPETNLSFEADEKRLREKAFKNDDFLSRFYNLTDSMPRDGQIAFTATVIAGRIMNQGMTDENQAFLKNVSNRFSPEEIGNLKRQVMADPAVSNKSSDELERFLQDFDKMLAQPKEQDNNLFDQQQARPRLRSVDDIFFQTAAAANPYYLIDSGHF